MRLETENGHTYDVSTTAVIKLQQCKNAREAEDIFDGFAPSVPRYDRCSIWFAVDAI